MKKAADAVKGAFDAAERRLRSAREDVMQKKEECRQKMDLECDRCRDLKCKKAKDDCKEFYNSIGSFLKDSGEETGIGMWCLSSCFV